MFEIKLRTLRHHERHVLARATVWYMRDEFPDDADTIEADLHTAVEGYLRKFKEDWDATPTESHVALLRAIYGPDVEEQ